MALIYSTSHVLRQCFWWANKWLKFKGSPWDYWLWVQKSMINSDAWECPQTIAISNTSSRLCFVNILPQFRTNVNLIESVICLVPGELWNFLEARKINDKCIEIYLWSYPYSLCDVVKLDRSQLKSRSLHNRKTPPIETFLLKLWIPQRYIGGLRKCFKVYIAEGVALKLLPPSKNASE